MHTTQFEIRDPQFNLYERVLTLAVEEMQQANVTESFIKIGGVCGPLQQAKNEALILKKLGYDLALLSMGGLQQLSEQEFIKHRLNRFEKRPRPYTDHGRGMRKNF